MISNEELKVLPFFKPFVSEALLTDAGSLAAVQNFPYIMGYEIPALSFAVGSTVVDRFVELFRPTVNINTFAKEVWPDERGDNLWLHNDFEDVAYLYTYELYDDIVSRGGMK